GPEPAKRTLHPPAMVPAPKAPEASERVLHRLFVVTEAVRAHADAAQRVAGTALIAQPGEDVAGFEVKVDRRRVVTLRIRQQPELAECEAKHQGASELGRNRVAIHQRLAGPAEVI